ncbi:MULTISPECIES: formylglycine-generating enzyme family protein [unclassified Microcoleus]|uniref:formylglycine-generating enzyme family protein n=1 Tax=unclassified Microcoleus TaxID=2642155 RepID=UPI002FD16069
MSDHQNEPREYDAVLGGQNLISVNAAILGGISGVKSRLASPAVEVRIAALSEAVKYEEAGLDLIIQALGDESMEVKLAAYSLLKDRDKEKLKQHLRNYFEFDVITVDAYGKESSRRKSFAHFFSEDLGNGIVLEIVYIPGGTFMMGSRKSKRRLYEYESPQYQVTVPAFFAGKYSITQAQWQAVMGNNPSHFKGEKCPVEQVSWDMAVEFCGKLSQQTGRKYRLLSQAEWEYACRAGTTTPFHFGETITPELVNYNGNFPYANAPKGLRREETTDVGSFPPNAFGLYDMHGNVWEWCSDRWHEDYQGTPDDGYSWVNGNDTRVQRGGSWRSLAVLCRSASRSWVSAGNCNSLIGFRVALVSA